MKTLVAQMVIMMAVLSGVAITAEANPVQPVTSVSISISASTSSVGVLAGK